MKEEHVNTPKGGVHFTFDTGKKGKTTIISGAPDSGGEEAASGETAAPPAGSGPWSARWTAFPLFLSEPVLDWETGQPLEGRPVLILVRTSLERETRALFGDLTVAGSERLELSRAVLGVMGALGIATVVVFAGASLLAGLLVYRIARATRRLSLGFAEIEKGNFAHRVVFKGHDQLAALVGSFNHMVAHLRRASRSGPRRRLSSTSCPSHATSSGASSPPRTSRARASGSPWTSLPRPPSEATSTTFRTRSACSRSPWPTCRATGCRRGS